MKITGLKDLEKKMKQLSNVARKEAKQEALYTGASVVLSQANDLVQVDTGYLKGSLDFEVGSDDADIFDTAIYAAAVEYGTSKMAAQPFLRPALDNNKDNIIKIFSDVYKKYLTR